MRGATQGRRFQSTHPVRGATNQFPCWIRPAGISIHAPRAGCDMEKIELYDSKSMISIHAPRAGCDYVLMDIPCNCGYISIHAPRAGCDCYYSAIQRAGRNFNPRTPCGVRLLPQILTPSIVHISIHAPRAGCDARCKERGHIARRFQSTHPVRGATISSLNH